MGQRLIRELSKNPDSGSIVELIYDEERERTFVRKRIQYINSPLSRAIFQKESEALSRLRSCENIVKIYNSEIVSAEGKQDEGVISMEYVPGVTLREKQADIPSVVDRYNIVRKILNAVGYAHENDIIHRDINPNNILVTEDDDVKLIDFGIAKILGSTSRAGTTFQFATSRYAAPEVTLHSEYATEQSDIYSLGAVIFFLFTGEEPSAPDRIQNEIERATGLDALLRSALKKMCAEDPNERYDSIEKCNVSLSPLYAQYCDNKERYYISVPEEHIETLRSRRMLPSTYRPSEILSKALPEQLQFGYAYMRFLDNVRLFCFDGRSITIGCVYKDDVFQVVSVDKLDSFRREQNHRRAFPVCGKMTFFFPSNRHRYPMRDSSNADLYNRFIDHEHNTKSKDNVDREFEARYGIWSQYLDAMIQSASKSAVRIQYKEVHEKDGILEFIVDKTVSESLYKEDFSRESSFAYEQAVEGKDKPKLVPVGTYLGLQKNGQFAILRIEKARKCRDLPRSGEICVDYGKEISQYRRQAKALEDLKRLETNNNGNMKSILSGIEEPERFVLTGGIEYFNKQLDPTQRLAVKKVLEANDVAIIQGPPGTGKTNVLVEVVRQILKQNQLIPAMKKMILIVSQSHAAVDNILEDLQPYLDGITTVRIGSEDKILPRINEQYGLEHCEQSWTVHSIQKCKNKLISRLSEQGISFEEFQLFSEAVEGLKIRNATEVDKHAWEKIVSTFLAAHGLERDSSYLRQCLPMVLWCRHLEEEKGLGEYYIKSAAIVAGTCSGFISNPFIRDIVFDCVIVDEAAKATFPELLVPFVRAKKVVLVGDHLQLPPILDQKVIREDPELDVDDLEKAGFGKIWNILPGECKQALDIQYRMHPCIGALISNLFYDGAVKNGVTAKDRSISLPFLSRPIMWLTTSHCAEDHEEHAKRGPDGNITYENPYEVTVLQGCLNRLDREMNETGTSYTVGIITPYRAQLELIRRRLQHETYECFTPDINTVDAFQGSQRDIIIYSTVRKNSYFKIGFMDKEARLNVSLSRAKRAIVLIGDSKFFNSQRIHHNIFRPIIQFMIQHQEDCKILSAKEVTD